MTGDPIDLMVMVHREALNGYSSNQEMRSAIRCSDCGALVLFVDSLVHEAWHERMSGWSET